MLASRVELGRGVETASDDDQILVDGGTGLHGHVPADHDERSVDDRRRANLNRAEDDDDIAAHVAVDGRRAEDDDGVVDRLSLLEGVVLADAQDVASPAAESVLPWILGRAGSCASLTMFEIETLARSPDCTASCARAVPELATQHDRCDGNGQP